MGCVKVVVEEDEEEKEDGVGDGEELGAVEEELAGPAVGETSERKKKEFKLKRDGQSGELDLNGGDTDSTKFILCLKTVQSTLLE